MPLIEFPGGAGGGGGSASGYQFPSGAQIDIYVNGGTGNDSNDGSAGSPFATIQKGLNTAANYRELEDYIVVHVADGTYTEELSVPDACLGVVYLVGNGTTPANVVIDADNAVSGECIRHDNTACLLYVDGVQLANALYGIRCDGGNVSVQYVTTDTVTYGVSGDNNSTVKFPTETDGAFTFTGVGAASIGVAVSNNSSLLVTQPVVMTNTGIGISANLGSLLYHDGVSAIDITMVSPGGVSGIRVENDSYFFSFGPIDVDGQAASASNEGFDIGFDAYAVFIFNTINIDDCFAGIDLGPKSLSAESSATITYTNCTNDLYVEESAIYQSSTDFDTSPTYYNLANVVYGFDNRYVQSTTAAAATGTIEFLADGGDPYAGDGSETIRIRDGAGGDVTFALDNVAGGGTARVDANNYTVDLGGGVGDSRYDLMAEFAYAVGLARQNSELAIDVELVNFSERWNGGSFNVASPFMDYIALTNQATGTAGNIAITTANLSGTEISVSGMSGGAA